MESQSENEKMILSVWKDVDTNISSKSVLWLSSKRLFANPRTFCIFDYLAIFTRDQSPVAVTGYDWDEKIEYFNEKSRRWLEGWIQKTC